MNVSAPLFIWWSAHGIAAGSSRGVLQCAPPFRLNAALDEHDQVHAVPLIHMLLKRISPPSCRGFGLFFTCIRCAY